MLLFEQKTGLFDSVDQCAWPVFIISALVDVKDYLNKTMPSFCGKKKKKKKSIHCSESQRLVRMKTKLWQTLLALLMVLNHETNGSNCHVLVTTAAEGF